MKDYCFLNGEVIDKKEAKVSIFDIGLLRGLGVYEAMPVFSSKILRFSDHWQRFADSAHFLNLNIPVTEEKAEKVILGLLEKNGQTNKRANVKFILTGGPMTGGLDYDFNTPTFCIFTEDHEPLGKVVYENGAKLITYNYRRDLPQIKTVNYATAVNLQNWRRDEGAVEILYIHEGEVSECSTSNVFIVNGGVLVTPAEGVLSGITRKIVLEIAKSSGLQVEERAVSEKEMLEADEVFITSSFKDIVPITKIDDATISDGQVGPVTRSLMEEFSKLTFS